MTSHGTYNGFMKHYRLGRPPCDACREARRAYLRERGELERVRKQKENRAPYRPWRCPWCRSMFKQHSCAMGDGW